MSPINRKLVGISINSRLAGYAALAGATLAVPSVADATIIYSGPVSIAIPDDLDGVYLNVVTGVNGTTAVTGYDINPYSAGAGTFNLWGPSANTWFTNGGAYNLAFGTPISGAAAAFSRPGGGTDIGTLVNLNSSNNYFGFRFTNEAISNQIDFGWVQIQFGATASDRTIIGYAYQNVTGTAITAGAIPEPSTMALLSVMAAGALGVRTWRKRKAA